jgi:hypothetical protein
MKSAKEQLLDTIEGIAFILYGTLATDIRIRPLEETHQKHFLRVLLEVHTLSQAANLASTQVTSPVKTPPPERR